MSTSKISVLYVWLKTAEAMKILKEFCSNLLPVNQAQKSG